MRTESAPPRLSVVIASYNMEKTIEACLTSLEGQSARGALEIIVVDSGTDRTAPLIREKFPQVRLFTSPTRLYPGEARNFGISQAQGEIIATTDADCEVASGWAQAILQAHQAPHPVIGGAIANANPESLVGWVAYFAKFISWIPGTPAGWMPLVLSANLTFKRAVFEECGPFLDKGYSSDYEYCTRLTKRGYPIRFDPAILVYHRNIEDFPYLCASEWKRGYTFARIRAEAEAFSRPRRFTYILLAWLIPLKIFLDIVHRAMRRREYLAPLLRVWPLLLVELGYWAAGEAAGYFQSLRPDREAAVGLPPGAPWPESRP